MWVNAFDLDETVPFVCSIPTHLRAHTSLAHSLNIHVKWIYDAANHRILLLFHILYSVFDVVLVVRRKMMARAKYQHKNEENREQTRCGYAILRQIVCSCLTKLLIPDKFSSRLFCLCYMLFSFTKCSNSNQPNLPNRVDTNNITFRHAIHSCVWVFYGLSLSFQFVSYRMHPPLHTYVFKSIPFSSKCRFAF